MDKNVYSRSISIKGVCFVQSSARQARLFLSRLVNIKDLVYVGVDSIELYMLRFEKAVDGRQSWVGVKVFTRIAYNNRVIQKHT